MPPEPSPTPEGRRSLEGASGAWDWDIAGDRLRADARFAELYGLDRDAARDGVPTATFFSAIDEADRTRVRISVAGVLHGAEVFAREYRLRDPGGGVRWVLARGGLTLDESGAPARFTGVLSDITEQKRVQQQLRIAQTAGGVGSFEYVSGFGTATVSEQFCALLGLLPADALPVRTINAVVAPGEPPIILGADTAPEQQSAYSEFRIRRADTGAERWLARRGELIRDAGPLGVRFVGVIYDVTDAKQAEARLRELAATLEQRVEARTQERDRVWALSRDLFAVTDRAGRLRATNPAWSRLGGHDSGELEGRDLRDLIHPDDQIGLRRMIDGLGRQGTVESFESRLRDADGVYRWIDWSGAAEDDELFLTGRDISHRKQLEEQLRQSQKMEAVGQLTGGLAHDFNNMLTGVIGSLDIIRRRIADGRTEDLGRFMDAASTSAERAAGLTHRLLAFSRQQSLDTRAVDVNELVGSMEDLLTRTLGEQTRLLVRLDAATWPAWSDANQLESAILNLAINARDAMPGGGVLTLETSNLAVAVDKGLGLEAGDYVRIRVEDTGEGIAPDVIDRVFDPFFTTKPIGQGTGLGLSMIYGFMRQAGGGVSIASEPGGGTTIDLYLPRAASVSTVQSDQAIPTPLGRGETILVVEDDPSVRLLVLDVLTEIGYAPLQASEAESALALLRGRHVDLLVTDVGLPGLNGRQLADMALTLQPHLRVLFMTGYAEQATDRGAFLGPEMSMITKPFNIDTLAACIRELMSTLPGA
ncbi:hybrid sensor histidine kinase/response regulator [Brevundimonas goettingensis]|uniref:histidine kinase n=1 Tax=Brevundimonas goettingensis TaxID=2774190 RepID=A0A975C2Z9_9CAUL|nr:PAS domain-containing protein [Brevundimonas goettingensis]QTC92896.1 PAS domain-containing protein [Brevundimonas goettingensis]